MSKIWVSPDGQILLVDGQEKPAAEYIASLQAAIAEASAALAVLAPRPVRSSRWTEQQEAELRRLHATGTTFAEIARAMGASREQIAGKCQRMGLVRNTVVSQSMKAVWAKAKAAKATR